MNVSGLSKQEQIVQRIIKRLASGFTGLQIHDREDLEQELWYQYLKLKKSGILPSVNFFENFVATALRCDALDWFNKYVREKNRVIYNSNLVEALEDYDLGFGKMRSASDVVLDPQTHTKED